MSILIILPACCFGFVFLLFYRHSAQTSWREAFLQASLVLGLLSVLLTEFLSLLNLIVLPAILTCWLIGLATAAILWFCTGRSSRIWNLFRSAKEGGLSKLLLIGLALYIFVIAMIAVVAPPNTWDSLEYHMPKVAHWIQNHNVSFYPTEIPRQNHQNPGAEYLILHLQVLTGSDRFANLIEWFSMVGSLVAASLIAGLLGVRVSGQLFAAVFVVSLPMGIMQASSTQTDYVAAFWLTCFVYFMLKLIRSKTIDWQSLFLLSVALGLALFTKATTYLYAPAFLIWMTLSLFQSYRLRIIKPLLVFSLIVLAISTPHFYRNFQLHGNPLGPGEEPWENSKYSCDVFSPASFLSNTIKNVASHLQTPWAQVNDPVEEAIVGFHDLIGFDVNDRRTTIGPASWINFSIRETTFHDEVDGNPLHLIVAIVCCVFLLAAPRLRKRRDLLKYTLCVVVALLAFSVYVKWSPWHSRTHMAVFVLAAPFCAAVVTTLLHQRIVNSAALVLLLCGIPWILYCSLRPLVGEENLFNTSRITLFFKNPARQDYGTWYQNGRAYLKDKRLSKVGLITINSSWEYIWWVMLQEDHAGVRIEHVNIADVSRRYHEKRPFSGFQPEVVVSLEEETSKQERIEVNGIPYRRQWSEGDTAIYLRGGR